jgi:protein gp37
MSKSKIEWTGETWNPMSGCTKISEGCAKCYAEKMAHRLKAMGAKGYENGFAVTLHPDRLNEPLKRKKPTTYFVCSMGDLFHEDVPFDYIDQIFAIMALTPQHTYQVLTKRPERMREYFEDGEERVEAFFMDGGYPSNFLWPLPNVWLGVTAENQEQADKRIPILLDTPAALRFVSIEPMLGEIDLGFNQATCNCCKRSSSRWIKLTQTVASDLPFSRAKATVGFYRAVSNKHGAISVDTGNGLLGIKPNECEYLPALDWVICGGETGAKARPMNPEWVLSIKDQCEKAGVPFFFKQWGEYLTLPTGKSLTAQNPMFWGDGRQIVRVGKTKAGHLIDGVEYREMPEAGK